MKKILIVLIVATAYTFTPLCGQSLDTFVSNYKEAFSSKNSEYNDTSLVYIPYIMNLYEQGQEKGWGRMTIQQRRDSLFVILNNPILASWEAIKLSTGEIFGFPTGLLDYKKKKKKLDFTQWFPNPDIYEKWYVPIIDYLKDNEVDYIFRIMNIGGQGSSGEYWTIEQGKLFALQYDESCKSYVRYAAECFLRCAQDDVFDPIGVLSNRKKRMMN